MLPSPIFLADIDATLGEGTVTMEKVAGRQLGQDFGPSFSMRCPCIQSF